MSNKIFLVLATLLLFTKCISQSSNERGLSLSIIPHNFINAGMIDVDVNDEFVDFRENTVFSFSTGVGYYWKRNKWTYQVGSNIVGLSKQIYINTRLWDFFSPDSEIIFKPLEKDVNGRQNFEQWRLGLFFNASRSFNRLEVGAGLSITGLLNASYGFDRGQSYSAVMSIIRNGVSAGGARSNGLVTSYNAPERVTMASLNLMYAINESFKIGISSAFWINALRFDALVYEADLSFKFEEDGGRRFDEASILNLTIKDPIFQAGFNIQYLIPFKKKGGDLEN